MTDSGRAVRFPNAREEFGKWSKAIHLKPILPIDLERFLATSRKSPQVRLESLIRSMAQQTQKSHQGKKPVRRNETYKRIDKALCEIAAAHPQSHEEVFRQL